jgi:hypothetical protein
MNPFAWRYAVTFLPIAILQGSCPQNTQPVPSRPIVTARPGTTIIFGGFIYPSSAAANTYEVDVPLVTDLPGTGSPAQVSYFGFEVNYRLAGLRTLELQWRPPASAAAPAPAIVIRKIDSPCDDAPAMSARLSTLRSNAARQTGRREIPASASGPPVGVPASFSPGVDLLLEAGTPVWWVTCNESGSGEVIAAGNTFVDYNVAILLPATLVLPPPGPPVPDGTLDAVALNLIGGARSAVTSFSIRPSPALIGVAGDSVAWGQGVAEGSKFYRLVAAALPSAAASAITGGTTVGPPRVVVKAHSAGVLGSGSATIAGAACGTSSSNPLLPTSAPVGEVPRRGPNIPCQIRDMAALRCSVTLPPTPPLAAPSPDPGPFTPTFICPGPAPSVTFDEGPRFDFVFTNGCINDVGPTAILLGLNGLIIPSTLVAATTAACDVRLSLPDIRTALPNAVVNHFGYHNIVSLLTDTSGLGCLPPPPAAVVAAAAASAAGALGLPAPPGPPAGPPAPLPPCAGFTIDDPAAVLCMLGIAPVQASVAARAALFLATSTSIMTSSVAAVAATPADGRGTFRFTPMPFTPANAILAPASQTWGLTCAGGPLAPVDPVAGPRALACSTAFNPTGTTPNSRGEETCRRASSFHPDTTGHATISATLLGSLRTGGFFRRP